MEPGTRGLADKIAVFIAEGFGIGRMPFAPGTFGTVLGFLWIHLLLLPRSVALYCGGILAGFFFAVWIGSWAEKVLQAKDPGSIVIDEIMAMPLAFLPAVVLSATGDTPLPFSAYLSGNLILLPLLTFALFRFFDIAKPLGIGRVQKIPGGLGLALDDFLAALAAALLLLVYMKIAG